MILKPLGRGGIFLLAIDPGEGRVHELGFGSDHITERRALGVNFF